LPGMSQVIRFTKNPREAAKEKLESLQKENQVVNLLKNPDFTESKSDWTFWQDKPLGTSAWDNGSVKLSKVQWGCLLQKFSPVKPGEYYYVSIDGKQQGAGQVAMRIRWHDAEGKWTKESEDRIFSFEKESVRLDGRPLLEGWLRAEGVVRIPESVASLQVQAGVRNQSNDGDDVWFDNAVLIRLQ